MVTPQRASTGRTAMAVPEVVVADLRHRHHDAAQALVLIDPLTPLG